MTRYILPETAKTRHMTQPNFLDNLPRPQYTASCRNRGEEGVRAASRRHRAGALTRTQRTIPKIDVISPPTSPAYRHLVSPESCQGFSWVCGGYATSANCQNDLVVYFQMITSSFNNAYVCREERLGANWLLRMRNSHDRKRVPARKRSQQKSGVRPRLAMRKRLGSSGTSRMRE